MTHVTSLELSKRLYEASGWVGTYFSHTKWKYDDLKVYETVKPTEEARLGLNSSAICPAYDSGFLLRQLPKKIYSELKEEYCYKTIDEDEKGYGAGYQTVMGFSPNKHWFFADTPEDALAELCLALFEAGVLKR